MRKLLVAIIKIYKVMISPFIGRCCRFHPGCSSYAVEAIEKHGSIRGSWLAVKRIGRCHPWNAGGYDPVPDPE
ncbi:membrane protein insertion efficiency factor YidD [Candidatus Spongiihabitans sp.]|uniref:membrane protein insertion efficiency factor YidD n=1 Tax=Candidatus Spongiihabitans sp. TaxID=3101308 RepID=UPI003C7B8AC2